MREIKPDGAGLQDGKVVRFQMDGASGELAPVDDGPLSPADLKFDGAIVLNGVIEPAEELELCQFLSA